MSFFHLPDEGALSEAANLSAEKTGVAGVIHMSTAQVADRPRAKWYPGRPARNAPCLSVTIEAAPQMVNHQLPAREFAAMADRVAAWVTLNHGALLDFWYNGHAWMDDEVTEFKAALRRMG